MSRMALTRWTTRRLTRLFARYNRRFWSGALPYTPVLIDWLGDTLGAIRFDRPQRIEINIDAHKDDKEVRSTLLHEMCHLGAGDHPRSRPSHGSPFWQQLENLLRQHAPITVDIAETGGMSLVDDVVPRRFPLGRRAIEKAARRRARKAEEEMGESGVKETKVVEDREIVQEFVDAAWEERYTWRDARLIIGDNFGLLNVDQQPKNRWAARIIAEARKAHAKAAEEKREYKEFFSDYEEQLIEVSDSEEMSVGGSREFL